MVSQNVSVPKIVLTPGEYIEIVYPIQEGSWKFSPCVSTSTVTSSYSAAITQLKVLSIVHSARLQLVPTNLNYSLVVPPMNGPASSFRFRHFNTTLLCRTLSSFLY